MKEILNYLGQCMSACDQEIYTIIMCYDGYDYIVVDENGSKKWIKYPNLDAIEQQELYVDPKYFCGTDSEEEEEKPKPKRKLIRKVKEEVKKKTYHEFIGEFIASNQNIPSKERMKAANEAYKIYKNK